MTNENAFDYKKAFTLETLEQSQVKLSGELPFEQLQNKREAAITHLGKNVKLDGFRPGHVPTAVLEKHLGEMTILTEMAERAIATAYPQIITAHDIDAIGHPQVSVTKIAPDNPLGVSFTVATVPTITLPDYEKIAKESNKNRPSDEVTDTDLEEKITEIQKSKRAYERMQELSQEQENADGSTDLPTPESEAKKAAADEDTPLPELTNEYVKTLGQPGQFETVEYFKKNLREHLEIEKKRDNAAKHRAVITDAIIDKTDLTLPQILIDSELQQMWAQMTDDIERSNLKIDDYLKHIGKTKEELSEEWKPAAEKRAQLQLVLNEIAKVRELTPNTEEVEAQAKQLMEQFKDADETRVKLYVASMMLNELVMKTLEEM